MDVKAVFARREASYIGDDLNCVASLRERDRAHHLTRGCGMKNSDGLFYFLRRGKGQLERDKNRRRQNNSEEEISFHTAKLHPCIAACKL